MTKLSPLSLDPNIYKKLIYKVDMRTARASRKCIHNNINLLNTRISILESNTNYPENITPHIYFKTSTLKDDLENLYSSKAKHILTFKDNLKEIFKKGCPYCNSYHPVSEIDHYLPISRFPEFSVHPYNLIYSCDNCNGLKLDKFLKRDGSRMFIYPYFDSFMETIQFLKCDLSTCGMKLDIKFYIDPSIETSHPYEFNIVNAHFNELQLKTYYQRQALDPLLSSLKSTWTSINPITDNPEWDTYTLNELQILLTYKLKEFQYFNINRWERVFLTSLINCTSYLNLVVNKSLPIN